MSHPQLKAELLEKEKEELNSNMNILYRNEKNAKKVLILCVILSFLLVVITTLQATLGIFNGTTGMLSLLAPNASQKILTLSTLVLVFDSIAIQMNLAVRNQQNITAKQIAKLEKQIDIQKAEAEKLRQIISEQQAIKQNAQTPTIEELEKIKQELLNNDIEPQLEKQNVLKMN